MGRKILVIFVKSFISFSKKEISALFNKKSEVKKDFNGKNKSNLDKINSSPLNKILGFCNLTKEFSLKNLTTEVNHKGAANGDEFKIIIKKGSIYDLELEDSVINLNRHENVT